MPEFTHPTAQALYGYILDNPDGDAPRLIYADWLEEHGDARAAFIRLDIQMAAAIEEWLAALPEEPEEEELDEFDDWEGQSQELLERHRRRGLRRVALIKQTVWAFHRGFIGTWYTTIAHFLEHAPVVYARIPRTALILADFQHTDQDVQRLARSSYLSRLRRLNL